MTYFQIQITDEITETILLTLDEEQDYDMILNVAEKFDLNEQHIQYLIYKYKEVITEKKSQKIFEIDYGKKRLKENQKAKNQDFFVTDFEGDYYKQKSLQKHQEKLIREYFDLLSEKRHFFMGWQLNFSRLSNKFVHNHSELIRAILNEQKLNLESFKKMLLKKNLLYQLQELSNQSKLFISSTIN